MEGLGFTYLRSLSGSRPIFDLIFDKMFFGFVILHSKVFKASKIAIITYDCLLFLSISFLF